MLCEMHIQNFKIIQKSQNIKQLIFAVETTYAENATLWQHCLCSKKKKTRAFFFIKILNVLQGVIFYVSKWCVRQAINCRRTFHSCKI